MSKSKVTTPKTYFVSMRSSADHDNEQLKTLKKLSFAFKETYVF